jgi:cadmium resistance protein CadD (predicted permease)
VVGLLGLLPLALGIREAAELAHARGATAPRARRPGALGVALITIANGGDNVAVYAPLFASSNPARVAGLAGIFLAMTGLWLCLAWFTVHNPLVGRSLSKWGRWLLPPVLVLLGAWILWENGTLSWLAGLAAGLFGG